jgi:anti-sigma factor RsiW
MERFIEQYLEEYLMGSLEPAKKAEFETRLEAADEYTRQTVAQFTVQGRLLRGAMRAPEDLEPSAGFYGRVLQRIEAQKASAWWLGFLEPAFSRRLAFASLTLLLLLGFSLYTVHQEPIVVASTPAEVMAAPAVDEMTGVDPEQGRETVLVDLAAFEE